MRVCLQCDSEYVDDPTTCRSCGAATVTVEEAQLQHQLRERLSDEKLVRVTELEGPVDEEHLLLRPDAAHPGFDTPLFDQLLERDDVIEHGPGERAHVARVRPGRNVAGPHVMLPPI